jgi:hypothetical protein
MSGHGSQGVLDRLRDLAEPLRRAGAFLSGEAAAHLHAAVATGSEPGKPPRYSALPPLCIQAIFTEDHVAIAGVTRDLGAVAGVVRARPDLFTTAAALAGTQAIPVVTREAAVAGLLAQGGLAIGLAGTLVAVAREPALDVDAVREILKAAGQGERFQPLLELLDVA